MKKLHIYVLLIIVFLVSTTVNAQTAAMWYTSKGTFKTVLTDTLTPRTVDSFIARVSDKFYDGLIFHRVINNFMIQGGDPLGTGYGGPGYYTPDEFDPSLKNVPGALAMANSGPNTNGSQFYINLVTNSHLDNHYTVFGMTTEGFTVVQDIGLVPTDANDRPLTDVVIDSIRITYLYSTAVKNISKTIEANVFPNPCRGIVNLDLPDDKTLVSIADIAGRIVYSTEAKSHLQIDMSNQPKGLYILQLTTTYARTEKKLVVE